MLQDAAERMFNSTALAAQGIVVELGALSRDPLASRQFAHRANWEAELILEATLNGGCPVPFVLYLRPFYADNVNWDNPSGGSFQVAENWNPAVVRTWMTT